LGANGIEEIMNHPWLSDFNWESLENKQIKAPFVPNVTFIFYFLDQLK
jgi:hypothetical protein